MGIEKYIDNIDLFTERFTSLEKELFQELTAGQRPETMLITCSDSRIAPQVKTGAKPGDIFVFRNMGNFIPPYREGGEDPTGVAAFLEYGVNVLGARHIIVLGHTNCGAIEGIFASSPKVKESQFIKGWLRNGDAVRRIVIEKSDMDDEKHHAEMGFRENVRLQVEHVHSYPFIRHHAGTGNLFVHGWLYDVRTAAMYYLSKEGGDFLPLTRRR